MNKNYIISSSIILLGIFFAFALLSFELKRFQTLPLIGTYVFLFLLIWIWVKKYSSIGNIFFLGIICRLIFWNYIPNLSQDFYRFIWDGSIQLFGINPYYYTPNQIIDLIGFPNSQLLFEKMGNLSRNNFSNYPPISQYLFALAANFNSENIFTPILCIRSVYLISDIIIFFVIKSLLEKLILPKEYLAWYFLNPLVIIEGYGNLHGECLMMCFTVISWLYCVKRQPILGGIFMAFAIGTKLLPLILVPFFFQYLGLKNFIVYGVFILIFGGIIFLPFWDENFFPNYLQTIQLWFSTFEFNGSIYNIIRAIGYKLKGYNIIKDIGKITPYVISVFVFVFSFIKSNREPKDIFKNMLFILSIYFFVSTTVHPWYIINLIILGILSGYLYPILWSMTVFWSYSAYGVEIVEEKLYWQIGAYFLVYICVFYELFRERLGHHLQKTNFLRT